MATAPTKAPAKAPAKAPVAAAKAPVKAPAKAPAPAPAPAKDPVAAKLAAMQARWDKAKGESKKPGGGGGGTTLTGGRHACRLTDCRLIDNDKGMSVVFEFTCVEGDETGEKAVRFAGMDTEERFVYLQRDLRRLGIDVDELEAADLPAICEALVEAAPGVRVTVKENGEYMNVYIDKLIDIADDAGAAGATAETDPEPEPDAGEAAAEAEAEAEPEAEAEAEPEAEVAAEELGFEVGSDVSYTFKGKKGTGVVKKILDDGTVDIRNDDTKKVDNVDAIKVAALAVVE